MRIKDLETHQEKLLTLVNFAQKHSKVDDYFVKNFTIACTEALPPSELEELNRQVRENVRLPVYTTDQAATWCGLGIDSIRDGIWRNKKLPSMKPGHDVLIQHEDLVVWFDERG
jgi:hypothetical protein